MDDIQIGNHTFRLTRKEDGTYKSEVVGKEEEGILLLPKEKRTLGKFESASEPGIFHYVIQYPDGDIYCTCFGFRSPDKCWHYRMVMEVGIEKITSPIEVTFKKEAPNA